MSGYTIDWSNTNIDGNNTIGGPSGNIGVSVHTPENQDHDQWMKGTVGGTNGLKAWDVNDPTKVNINFHEDVTNISFDLIDVDSCDHEWDDRVKIIAKDAHGNILPVTFTGTNSSQHVNGNQIDATSNSIGQGDAGHNVGVHIAGPVASLEIIFDNGSGANISGTVGLSDIHFDAAAAEDGYVDGTSGNDVIDVAYDGDPDGDRINNTDAILPGEGPNDDIVLAGAGNDIVRSGDGDDEVYGDNGDDMVFAGNGDDVVYGGRGDDKVEASKGDDVVIGGKGNDDIWGGKDEDILSGGEGHDTVIGGDGDDIVSGGKGNDTLDGGKDDDVVFGGAGSDSILGGEGDDTLIGGNMSFNGTQDFNDLDAGELVDGQYIAEGVTITSGDPKTPVMAFDSAHPTGGDNDLATNNLGKVLILSEDRDGSDPDDNAGGGTFHIDFEAPADVTSLTLLDVEEGAWVKYFDGQGNLLKQVDVTTANNGQHVIHTNLHGVCKITVELAASGAIDNLSYSINPDTMDGNDVIAGGAGDDIIEGNAGNDDLSGDAGDDAIDGGAGDDFIDGGEGADELFGGDDRDTLVADADDTVVDGGAGGDDFDILDLTGKGPYFLDNVTPDSNGNGIDGTVVFVDADGNPTGETLTFTEIEQVIGDEVNRGPDAQDDTAEVDEDGEVTIDVLDNDSDPDGDDLEVIDASSPDGEVTINPDGTITFTPDENFNGETTITYTVDDGNGGTDTATVTVTVNPVNDDPVAVDDADTTDEDTPITVDLLANDSDIDGDDLTVTEATLVSGEGEIVDNGDGTVTFTPAPDFNGEAVIDYTVSDGNGGTASASHTITVEAVDDAPDAQDDVAETDEDTPVIIDVLDNDSDPDGDPLEVTEATSPDGEVEIRPNGTIRFIPDENFNGETTITYTVTDPDGNEDTATVTVTVNPVNDAPEANDDSDTTDFNTPVTVDLLDNDTDVDGDDLTVISAEVDPDEGSLEDNGDGTVTFTPAPGFTGTATITYTIEDEEGLTDTAIHTITVGDAPLDGTVEGTAGDDLIDGGYLGDPDGDRVDNDDAILPGDVGDDDLIFGFEGDDTILAGAGDDEVFGGEGDDSILGQGGFDTLSGDEGDDTITGGRDDDTIFGGQDDDVLDGDSGDDSIEGNEGEDVILGGGGDDIIRGGMGNDTIDGENNDDTIFGGAGDDDLSGGTGDDSITGGSGDDVVDGGAGDDNVLSGSGDDDVFGGSGNDTLTTGDGNDEVEGGDGDDIIDTSGHLPLPDLSFGDIIPADGVIPGSSPTDDLDTVFGGAGNDTITTGDDADVIFGGAGRDVIDGGIDADTIEGGDGNDTIIGGEGSDSISGGEGNDTIFAGIEPGTTVLPDVPGAPFIEEQILDADDPEPDNGDDLVFGGAGNDTIFGADDSDELYGDEGNDVLNGEIDDDTLFGGDGNDALTGGQGADDQFGGFGNDTFIVDQEGDGAGDVVVGGEDPDDGDVDVLDLTGSGVDFITYEDDDPEAGEVTFLDGTTMTFSEIENVIPCFTPGTTIATPKGERLVEELREGDRIITRDNGIQEIRWVGRKDMTGKALMANPHLKPILIQAGSLGNGLPERDMLVSPNHRVLVASDKTQLYFEEREVLAAAKHLIGADGIHDVDVLGTSYIHFMFDRHEVVLSNGAWTESFQPGDYSLKGIGNAQRTEILELFPELQEKEGLEGYQSARRSLKKHEAKLLVK